MTARQLSFLRFTKDMQWSQVVISLVVSALYCLSFAFLLDRLLPDNNLNVTRNFIGAVWKILLATATILSLLIFLLSKTGRDDKPIFSNKSVFLSPADVVLVLLPLTPIVQYVLNNQNILSLSGSLLVVGVFAVFTMVFVLFIPTLFSKFGAAKILMMVGIAFAFTVADMAALTAKHDWFEYGNLIIQLALFCAVFAITALVYGYIGRKFAYFVVLLYFVSNSIYSFSSVDQTGTEVLGIDTGNRLVQLVGDKTPETTPSIYFLVYDAYVANETMLSYGIDNSAQEEYLAGLGFKLYPHTYSTAAFTIGTMSRVFSVSSHYYGQPRTAASGNGVVQHLLQGFGYKTYGLFWSDYFFQAGGSSYDYSYPELSAPHWMLTKAILMGEFRFDVKFDNPERQEFVDHKYRVFGKNGRSPKLVYMHDNRPNHSQNSGKCLPDETELFAARLDIANAEMKENLTAILRDDPEAIIIVAGDHGPYLTKNCKNTGGVYQASDITRQDIQDRYGTFLAIKWPTDKGNKYDDIVVIQDVFPAIFATIFDDARYLNAKIKPKTMRTQIVSGVSVRKGIIHGGPNDNEPLFLSPK